MFNSHVTEHQAQHDEFSSAKDSASTAVDEATSAKEGGTATLEAEEAKKILTAEALATKLEANTAAEGVLNTAKEEETAAFDEYKTA